MKIVLRIVQVVMGLLVFLLAGLNMMGLLGKSTSAATLVLVAGLAIQLIGLIAVVVGRMMHRQLVVTISEAVLAVDVVLLVMLWPTAWSLAVYVVIFIAALLIEQFFVKGR